MTTKAKKLSPLKPGHHGAFFTARLRESLPKDTCRFDSLFAYLAKFIDANTHELMTPLSQGVFTFPDGTTKPCFNTALYCAMKIPQGFMSFLLVDGGKTAADGSPAIWWINTPYNRAACELRRDLLDDLPKSTLAYALESEARRLFSELEKEGAQRDGISGELGLLIENAIGASSIGVPDHLNYVESLINGRFVPAFVMMITREGHMQCIVGPVAVAAEADSLKFPDAGIVAV